MTTELVKLACLAAAFAAPGTLLAAAGDNRTAPASASAGRSNRDTSDAERASGRSLLQESAITTKVKAKLAAENIASLMRISVATDDSGVVTLSGEADSREEATKAESLARNVEGVRGVQNHIRVATSR